MSAEKEKEIDEVKDEEAPLLHQDTKADEDDIDES